MVNCFRFGGYYFHTTSTSPRLTVFSLVAKRSFRWRLIACADAEFPFAHVPPAPYAEQAVYGGVPDPRELAAIIRRALRRWPSRAGFDSTSTSHALTPAVARCTVVLPADQPPMLTHGNSPCRIDRPPLPMAAGFCSFLQVQTVQS